MLRALPILLIYAAHCYVLYTGQVDDGVDAVVYYAPSITSMFITMIQAYCYAMPLLSVLMLIFRAIAFFAKMMLMFFAAYAPCCSSLIFVIFDYISYAAVSRYAAGRLLALIYYYALLY